jgi:hypothetical protein
LAEGGGAGVASRREGFDHSTFVEALPRNIPA